MNNREALHVWDTGEPIEVVEMGGLGSGYELALQTAMFEILRDAVAANIAVPEPREGGYEKPWPKGIQEFFDLADASLHRADKELNLGLSGAQAGAAKNEAYQFVAHNNWSTTLATIDDKNRIITIRKRPIPTMTPSEALQAGMDAARSKS